MPKGGGSGVRKGQLLAPLRFYIGSVMVLVIVMGQCWRYCISVQVCVRLGQVRLVCVCVGVIVVLLGQVRLDKGVLGQFRLGQCVCVDAIVVLLGQVRLDKGVLGQFRLGQCVYVDAIVVLLCQIRLWQVRLGQVRLVLFIVLVCVLLYIYCVDVTDKFVGMREKGDL